MISAVVPARDEEQVIAACVNALAAQPEIAEILVINDQSRDKTADIVKALIATTPQLRLLQTQDVPGAWVGKNYAAWVGAKQASHRWLLFTDADGKLLPSATARALQIAQETGAALVSFSPEQVVRTWYERALIPFVYTRLAKLFSYSDVNNPVSQAAAANGQFLMIRRDAYEAIGGHESVAAEVLEDVALARRAKAAGYRIWFGPAAGLVRVRMYRSFAAMWEGWKKNLYLLVGGTPAAVYREMFSVVPWIPFLLVVLAVRFPLAFVLGLGLLLARHAAYGMALSSNRFPLKFILYYVPGVLLYAGVLWASYRAHVRGIVEWKGRQVSVKASE
jgi:cellulose synthase/poly-beta-1,6-N-acetylglucosamine synthase-like glycosyltransferase